MPTKWLKARSVEARGGGLLTDEKSWPRTLVAQIQDDAASPMLAGVMNWAKFRAAACANVVHVIGAPRRLRADDRPEPAVDAPVALA